MISDNLFAVGEALAVIEKSILGMGELSPEDRFSIIKLGASTMSTKDLIPVTVKATGKKIDYSKHRSAIAHEIGWMVNCAIRNGNASVVEIDTHDELMVKYMLKNAVTITFPYMGVHPDNHDLINNYRRMAKLKLHSYCKTGRVYSSDMQTFDRFLDMSLSSTNVVLDAYKGSHPLLADQYQIPFQDDLDLPDGIYTIEAFSAEPGKVFALRKVQLKNIRPTVRYKCVFYPQDVVAYTLYYEWLINCINCTELSWIHTRRVLDTLVTKGFKRLYTLDEFGTYPDVSTIVTPFRYASMLFFKYWIPMHFRCGYRYDDLLTLSEESVNNLDINVKSDSQIRSLISRFNNIGVLAHVIGFKNYSNNFHTINPSFYQILIYYDDAISDCIPGSLFLMRMSRFKRISSSLESMFIVPLTGRDPLILGQYIPSGSKMNPGFIIRMVEKWKRHHGVAWEKEHFWEFYSTCAPKLMCEKHAISGIYQEDKCNSNRMTLQLIPRIWPKSYPLSGTERVNNGTKLLSRKYDVSLTCRRTFDYLPWYIYPPLTLYISALLWGGKGLPGYEPQDCNSATWFFACSQELTTFFQDWLGSQSNWIRVFTIPVYRRMGIGKLGANILRKDIALRRVPGAHPPLSTQADFSVAGRQYEVGGHLFELLFASRWVPVCFHRWVNSLSINALLSQHHVGITTDFTKINPEKNISEMSWAEPDVIWHVYMEYAAGVIFYLHFTKSLGVEPDASTCVYILTRFNKLRKDFPAFENTTSHGERMIRLYDKAR